MGSVVATPSPVRLLRRRYSPVHDENRMRFEGDTTHARQAFLAASPRNLTFPLRNRYA